MDPGFHKVVSYITKLQVFPLTYDISVSIDVSYVKHAQGHPSPFINSV